MQIHILKSLQPIQKHLQNRKIQTALIIVLTLIILLVTESPIGLTWDEDIYMRASKIYTDWMGKLITQPAEALSKEGINESWSFNHEHPPMGKIWGGLIWQGARFIFNDLTAHRLGNMILVSIMAGLLYLLIAPFYGSIAGLAAVFALLTMPRFFMHSHLAALDTTAAYATFIVIFLFWKTRDDPGWKSTLGLTLAWALALATKFSAIFIPAILFLWILIFRRQFKLFLRIGVMTLVGFLFSFAIWPWIYTDIPGHVKEHLLWNTIEHVNIAQWYLGQLHMPPPWHYTFIVTLAIIPLTVTLLSIIGIVRSTRKWKEAENLGGLLIIGAFLPLLTFSVAQTKLYDQERIFLFILPFLAALAGIGFGWFILGIKKLAKDLKKTNWIKPAIIVAFLLAFLPQSIIMAQIYPHLLSYYSANVGGLPGAKALGMETTYWCESYAAAIPYLNEHAEPGDMIWVDPLSQNVMVYYQIQGRLRDDLKIAYSPHAPTWPFVYEEYGPPTIATYRTSNFIVLQHRQTLIGSTREKPDRDFFSPHPDFQWIADHEPVYQLSHSGVPIMEIYKNTPAKNSINKSDSQSKTEESKIPIPSDWQIYKSETGKFQVHIPPGLEFSKEILEVDSTNLHTYYHFDEDHRAHDIYYYENQAVVVNDTDIINSMLDGHRDGWLNFIKGTAIEEQDIFMGDHPGRKIVVEATFNDLPITIKARYYLVNDHFFQISIWVPKDMSFPQEMEAFLQSFKILEN